MKLNEIEGIAFSNEWFSGQHRIAEAGHYPFAIFGLLWYIEPMDVGINITIENILLWFKMETTKRRNADKIKEALKYLHEQGIMVFYEDIQHTIPASIDIDQIKNRSPLYIGIKERPQDKYTLIRFSEFRKLLLDEVHTGNAKVELMCYFSAIIFQINNETKRAFPSISLLNSEACVGRIETCSEYNDHLMDNLKLIRFQSSGKINPDTGNPYPTQYVRYEDLEALEEEMKRQESAYRGESLDKMLKVNSNNRASISAKITHKQKKIDAIHQDGAEISTSEHVKLTKEIQELRVEYSALLIEYENLKSKKTQL